MNDVPVATPELLVHQYAASPYCEKLRLLLGHKQLSWRAVEQPMVMPKPQMVPLTGGYRRVPVLQIGADVYCDSLLIAEELERRFAQSPLFPKEFPAAAAAAEILAHWADVYLFDIAVMYVFGLSAEHLPEPLLRDRAAMRPGANFSPQIVRAQVPQILSQLLIALDRLEHLLQAAPYVAGAAPGYADYSVYHCLWFARRVAAAELGAAQRPALAAWMARIAAVGHGRSEPLAAADALAVAHAAEPAPLPYASDAQDPSGLRVGDAVSVMATTNGTETITGRIAGISRTRVSLYREAAEVGRVAVHFPRLGYSLRKV